MSRGPLKRQGGCDPLTPLGREELGSVSAPPAVLRLIKTVMHFFAFKGSTPGMGKLFFSANLNVQDRHLFAQLDSRGRQAQNIGTPTNANTVTLSFGTVY